MRNSTADLACGVSVGKEIEGFFVQSLREEASKRGLAKLFTTYSGTAEDLHQGTDCKFGSTRIDPTAGFEWKHSKNMRNWVETGVELSFKYLTLKFAVRTGNNHRKFKFPVVVIGFDMPNNLIFRYEDAIEEEIRKNSAIILDTAVKVMKDYKRSIGYLM